MYLLTFLLSLYKCGESFHKNILKDPSDKEIDNEDFSLSESIKEDNMDANSTYSINKPRTSCSIYNENHATTILNIFLTENANDSLMGLVKDALPAQCNTLQMTGAEKKKDHNITGENTDLIGKRSFKTCNFSAETYKEIITKGENDSQLSKPREQTTHIYDVPMFIACTSNKNENEVVKTAVQFTNENNNKIDSGNMIDKKFLALKKHNKYERNKNMIQLNNELCEKLSRQREKSGE